jgi:lipocalin
MFRALVLCLSATIALVSAGKCPTNVTIQKGLDLSKYTGAWYSVARIKNAPFENGQCEQTRYKLTDASKGTIEVLNSQYNAELDTIDYVKASATCAAGQCAITFRPGVVGSLSVLETDYKSYSVVYSCTEIQGKADPVWYAAILSRSKDVAQLDAYLSYGKGLLARKVPGFPVDQMLSTRQDNKCFYLKQKPSRDIFGGAKFE